MAEKSKGENNVLPHDDRREDPEPSYPDCFVIMPISSQDGYAEGHFERVYSDILEPACSSAGFRAIHPDMKYGTSLIHEDILRKLVDAPMVLCDLSARNPNVLFELGLRQAFDKPVALVRDESTTNIFDIAPLKYEQYRSQRLYHEVIEDQQKIAGFIKQTWEAWKSGNSVNSLIKLLSLRKPASLEEVSESERDPVFQVLMAEINQLRDEVRRLATNGLASPSVNLGRLRENAARQKLDSLVRAGLSDDEISLLLRNYGVPSGWIQRNVSQSREARREYEMDKQLQAAMDAGDTDDIPF